MLSNCIPLQKTIVYGPILSRRLGRSLGVNILSPYRKVCSFDCVYCQYGKTTILTDSPESHLFFGLNEIEREVVKALRSRTKIDYVTLSGNGEPTLHPLLYEIVVLLKKIILRENPSVKLALFSNSSKLHEPMIKVAINMIDAPILKLDSAIQDEMMRINHPAGEKQIRDICYQLSLCAGIAIQTLFIGGEKGNSNKQSIDAWIEALIKISPKKVFIYSSDSDFCGSEFYRLEPKELLKIENYAKQCSGLDINAFWAG